LIGATFIVSGLDSGRRRRQIFSCNIKDVGLNGFAVAGCGTVAGCADPGYDFEGRELISASSLEERIA
jgi:hypothetical protein